MRNKLLATILCTSLILSATLFNACASEYKIDVPAEEYYRVREIIMKHAYDVSKLTYDNDNILGKYLTKQSKELLDNHTANNNKVEILEMITR